MVTKHFLPFKCNKIASDKIRNNGKKFRQNKKKNPQYMMKLKFYFKKCKY